MTDRQRLRLEAAQATVAVLAAQADLVHQQLTDLADDLDHHFEEIEGHAADLLPGAGRDALRRAGQAKSAIQHLFSLTSEAVEWEEQV